MRKLFNEDLDPKEVGTRSRMIVTEIASAIVAERPDLAEHAQELAVNAMEAAGFKKPVPKTRGKATEATPETGYLVFMSQLQIDALARAAIEASDAPNSLAALKAAKVKDLVDADHSIDIALFGRMIADSADLNVDAACQVAHAISVHEATPEYDFYTAVDDAKARDEDDQDAGAGMMGTVGYVSSTLYRYAVLNVDQLRKNLGSDDATGKAIGAFLRSFIASMPTGKLTSFANGTRPSAIIVTTGQGQPASLVGAFEEPITSKTGYVRPAISRLAQYADEVFSTWRRPELILVTGLPSDVKPFNEIGEHMLAEDLIDATISSALEPR